MLISASRGQKLLQPQPKTKDLEDKILDVQYRLKHKIAKSGGNSADERDSRRWGLGLGVEAKVRNFMVKLKTSNHMHEMCAKFRRPKIGVTRRNSDPISWQLATIAIAVLRCSGAWYTQENANKLLGLMKAEFSAIYFPRSATVPKMSMISVEQISATYENIFEDAGIVERLDTVPENSSVIILMHGHAGFSTNMNSWARLASHFDSSSIYSAYCTQATRISNRVVEHPHRAWTILLLDGLIQAWEDTPDPNYHYMVGKMEGAHFACQMASALYGDDGIEPERMFDKGWDVTPAVVSYQFDEHVALVEEIHADLAFFTLIIHGFVSRAFPGDNNPSINRAIREQLDNNRSTHDLALQTSAENRGWHTAFRIATPDLSVSQMEIIGDRAWYNPDHGAHIATALTPPMSNINVMDN
ncbi:hypothetical protein MMC22_003475 [Lobaria immixta]|nr:hypothetical protein [Lobaria immixta]